MEKRLTAVIVDNTNVLRSDINQLANARSEALDSVQSTMEAEIPKLEEGLRTETTERK